MSKNADILRTQIEALNRGDFDAWLEGLAPDVEFREPPETPDFEEGRGREAALASLMKFYDVVEDMDVEVTDVTELGDPDRLLLTTHVAARGKGSGVRLEFDRYDVITMRDGKTVRDEVFMDRGQALEAAGLSE